MVELKKVIGSQVISLADATIVGEVKNVYFDESGRSARYLGIASDDRILVYPFDEVRHFGDAIVISDGTSLRHIEDIDASCLKGDMPGKQVFSPVGIFIGKIDDAHMFNNGRVARYLAGDVSITPSQLQLIGDVALEKGRRASSKVKLPRPEIDAPVYILQEDVSPVYTLNQGEPAFSEGALNILLAGSPAEYAEEDGHTPTRIISDYAFLLGRTLSADLKTYSGELIAAKDSEVTAPIVEAARRAGKLVELTLSSAR